MNSKRIALRRQYFRREHPYTGQGDRFFFANVFFFEGTNLEVGYQIIGFPLRVHEEPRVNGDWAMAALNDESVKFDSIDEVKEWCQ